MVFITGVFRSGTTLLARIVSAHSDAEIVYQPFFPFFKKWRDRFLEEFPGADSGGSLPMGSGEVFNRVRIDALTECGAKVVFSQSDVDEITAALTREAARDKYEKPELPRECFEDLHAGLAGEVFMELADRLHKEVNPGSGLFGIKEIWCEEFSGLLSSDPLDWTCLHILRDPRAVFASRNTGRYLESCGGRRYPLRFIAESWKRSVMLADRFAAADKVYRVQYEKIITDSAGQVAGICSRLGLKPEQSMLDPSGYRDARGNPWIPNSTGTNVSRGMNRAPLTYWRSALSDEEIGAIEYLCGVEMTACGYALRYSENEARELYEQYHEKEHTIQPWLRNYALVREGDPR